MRHLRTLGLAAVAFALGCGDRQPVTAPNASTGSPRFDISDGAHDNGNDGFFFLPPMVKEPVSNSKYKDERFHGAMRAHIDICELNAALACVTGGPFKRFTPEQIQVADEKYQVSWDTKEKPLVDGKVYRIQVFVGDVRLGYADVQHADRASELKNIDTQELVPLVDGRTLPIKFRIEQGALCTFNAVCTSTFVDKDEGGTFYAADEGAAIDFDPGVLPVDVVLTIERVPVPPGTPCVAAAAAGNRVFQQWEGCYRISTAPDIAPFGGFTGPTEGNPARAIVAVCIESSVPASLRENLALHKFDADGEVPLQRPEPVVPPFDFPCDDFEGTASSGDGAFGLARDAFGTLASAFTRLVGPRPLYAVDGGLGCILAFADGLSTFFWGLPVTAAASAGDEQEAPVGTSLSAAPSVSVRTFHADQPEEGDEFVSGVPVTFTVTGGGGTLLTALGAQLPSTAVMTNSDGIATLPSGWTWKLGNLPGVNTLVASGPFENGSVSFTAEAFVPVVQTLIACSPEGRGGDQISRGWYIPSFPGVTLTSVALELLSRPEPDFDGNVAGTYTFDLTARTSSYAGPVVGTSRIIIALDGASTPVPATFAFPGSAVPQGSLLTFSLTMVSGPARATVFYNVAETNDPSCPITQTNNTSPPLSTFRRQGIVATIVGGAKAPVIP
jgi:hypothetical protein